MDERYFYFNAEHFQQYSGKNFEPIVERSRATKTKKLFLPLCLSYRDFCQCADIAAEASEKTLPAARGGWKRDISAVKCLLHGVPEWRILLSSAGCWSVWGDIRAASRPELEYAALQSVAEEGLDRFIHELTRTHGDITAAAHAAGIEMLRRDQRQGLPAEAGKGE